MVQAAGRVIRSTEDRGVIHLLDDRFARQCLHRWVLLPVWIGLETWSWVQGRIAQQSACLDTDLAELLVSLWGEASRRAIHTLQPETNRCIP